MATIKNGDQNRPINRRRESNDVRGVCWRDFPDSSAIKVLSGWFRFFFCSWWHSSGSKLTAEGQQTADIKRLQHFTITVLQSLFWSITWLSNRAVIPLLSALSHHHRGGCGNTKRFSVLKTLSFVFLSPVTDQMKQKPAACRRCRCSWTAARGFCGRLTAGRADVHWSGLMSLVLCRPCDCSWLKSESYQIQQQESNLNSGLDCLDWNIKILFKCSVDVTGHDA